MEDEIVRSAPQIHNLADFISQIVVVYGIKLLGAVVALIVGFWLVGRIKSGLVKLMERRDVDPSLRSFT